MKKVRPKLKGILSPDVIDLEKVEFDPREAFCVFIQATFGPEDAEGEESFGFLICNQLWVDSQRLKLSGLPGKYLVVPEFNYDRIVNDLENIARECEGENWTVAAQKLSQFGEWEFDNYMP